MNISDQMSNDGRAFKAFGGIFCVIIHSTAVCNKTAEWYLMAEGLFNNIQKTRQKKQVDKRHQQRYLFRIYLCREKKDIASSISKSCVLSHFSALVVTASSLVVRFFFFKVHFKSTFTCSLRPILGQ